MLDINKDILYFSAYFLLHLLLLWRLRRYVEKPRGKWILTAGMAAGYLAMSLQLGLVGGIWQGAVLLAGLLVPLEMLLHRLLKQNVHLPLVLGFLTTVLLFTAYSLCCGRALPRIATEEITLKEWSSEEPRRLVQLSDLHLKADDSGRLRRIVERVNALEAHWIVLTGDLSVGKEWPKALAPEFRRLRARGGVFAVRGNHEIRKGGVEGFVDFCRKAGIRPLVNESLESEGLVIAGVDEMRLKKIKKERKAWNRPGGDLEKTLKGVSPNRPILLLAHRGDWAYRAERMGVDLMLCGHTHGGQLPPISWLVSVLDPFPRGRYRVGGMTLMVSEGAGVWDYLPLRLFTNNTINLYTLTTK